VSLDLIVQHRYYLPPPKTVISHFQNKREAFEEQMFDVFHPDNTTFTQLSILLNDVSLPKFWRDRIMSSNSSDKSL